MKQSLTTTIELQQKAEFPGASAQGRQGRAEMAGALGLWK
jgi:hypothetical protein